jgi:hypothetical protein
MQPIWCNVAALAVAVIFLIWRTHQQVRHRQERALRERVAHMLWVMAEQVEGSARSVRVS